MMLLLSVKLFAPEFRAFYLIADEPISGYEPLVRAVTWIESMDGLYVYNPAEEAVGWFQIRQCRVDHYNRLLGTSYVLEDFYDYALSRKMFLYFAAGKSFEQAARQWNGSGPMTIDYWNRIKVLL